MKNDFVFLEKCTLPLFLLKNTEVSKIWHRKFLQICFTKMIIVTKIWIKYVFTVKKQKSVSFSKITNALNHLVLHILSFTLSPLKVY